MTNETTSPVEVTQDAREAAALFVEKVGGYGFSQGHHDAYRNGEGDQSALVQTFAAFEHRIASRATDNALAAELRSRWEGVHSFKSVLQGGADEQLVNDTIAFLAALKGEG